MVDCEGKVVTGHAGKNAELELGGPRVCQSGGSQSQMAEYRGPQQLRGEKVGRAGCFNATIRYVAPMGYPLNSAEHDPSVERRGLLLSVVGALGMAALGIGFFFATDSVAVLLDGLFSLISFAVSLIAIRVAALVQQPDDECFHFGYAAYEPMLNLIKGLLISFVTVFAMISAIGIVLNGGREIQGSIVVVYALVAAVGCLVIAAVQRRAARVTGSPLLAVDSKNWLIDGAFSAAVAVAFSLVVLLGDGPLAVFKPYADPAVVIVLSVLAAPIPLQIIRSNWRQLLGSAPSEALRVEAHERVRRALDGVPGVTPRVRMLETGRNIYLQLYLILDEEFSETSTRSLDRLRERIHEKIVEDSPDIGVDIIFTHETRWVRRTINNR